MERRVIYVLAMVTFLISISGCVSIEETKEEIIREEAEEIVETEREEIVEDEAEEVIEGQFK